MTRRSGFGWLEFILGILLIGLAVFTFISPDLALGGVVFVYGVLAIISGALDIMLYFQLEQRTNGIAIVSLITGIIGLLAGTVLLFNPAAGAWVIGILLPVWFIAHSISRLCDLGYIRAFGGTMPYVASLILGILGIVVGVLLLINPVVSAHMVVYIIGAYLLLLGIGHTATAFSGLGASR